MPLLWMLSVSRSLNGADAGGQDCCRPMDPLVNQAAVRTGCIRAGMYSLQSPTPKQDQTLLRLWVLAPWLPFQSCSTPHPVANTRRKITEKTTVPCLPGAGLSLWTQSPSWAPFPALAAQPCTAVTLSQHRQHPSLPKSMTPADPRPLSNFSPAHQATAGEQGVHFTHSPNAIIHTLSVEGLHC